LLYREKRKKKLRKKALTDFYGIVYDRVDVFEKDRISRFL